MSKQPDGGIIAGSTRRPSGERTRSGWEPDLWRVEPAGRRGLLVGTLLSPICGPNHLLSVRRTKSPSNALRHPSGVPRHAPWGWQHVREVQHALLIVTALDAFGDDPRATFYIEIRSTAGNVPRPDLILLHPDVGVLVIENKGIALADVHGVEGTSLHLVRGGRLTYEDPFQQADRVMFRLADLTAMRADRSDVLFLHTAALPRIGRDEFESRFGTRWPDETLFGEECGDPKRFRRHILGFADHTLKRVRRPTKLTARAAEAVKVILSGKGFVYAPRRTYVDETDQSLIGVQVQQMELSLKEPTHQQAEYGKTDLRGAHRLFRGVAGSGKSIMLALSVARTLSLYREEREGDLFAATKRPKARVLVVCFNKTLVHYLRQRVEDRFGASRGISRATTNCWCGTSMGCCTGSASRCGRSRPT